MALNKKIDAPSLREMLQFRNIGAEWKLKTSYQKYCYIYGIGKYSLRVLGIYRFNCKKMKPEIAYN